MNSIEIFLDDALRHFNRFGRQGQKRAVCRADGAKCRLNAAAFC
ncbi:TPA: hypothetical protein ACFM5D_000007 [Neisseria meningitidis]|nr:hypothetical protein [Neisseria meningitidis]MCV6688571.1 hypothetical protein [Neisseria meningitidis]MCV6693472.1 hypothetical protein [Neisseria meningitidis]MCV6697666.1 hypothetical protein [Neisseria meningitidis]MCV6699595.1 hypothetical protein [Neisseria meningitidis]MCV6701648.1 hypothetical protein [Neisseria meningitidis]